MNKSFTNTGKLVKFILKRDRIITTVWIVALVLFSMAVAPTLDSMFSQPEARTQFGQSFNNPVMVAMMGPVYGLDNYTTGVMYAGTMLLWILIAVAIMNIFFVVRHTRADEESGRVEVIRSLPTGRIAILHATMISSGIINTILAVLLGFALAVLGIEGMKLADCILYGAVVGATGLVFASIAAIFSQLSSNKSTASGLSFLAVGVFYLIRAAGDVQGSELLSCISSLGLAQRSQVFVENNIIPIIILEAEAIIITIAAYMLNSLRDMGQGFIAPRQGRETAAKSMLSPFGFSLRLMYKSLIIWIVLMFVLGASYGSVISDIPTFVGDSPEYLQVIGVPEMLLNTMSDSQKAQIIIDYFGVFVVMMMTLLAFVPVMNASLKLRSEEREGRQEQLIAMAVPKTRYFVSYIILAFIISILAQLSTAYGLYISTSMTGSGLFTLDGLIKSFLVYLPAIWVMIGFVVFMTGAFPKATGAVWGFYGVIFVVAFLGGMPDLLPKWFQNISPMQYIPKLPMDTFEFTPLIILTIIASALIGIGLAYFKKRDLYIA
ncbi:MAG: hypothetical protein FWG88_06610 [Oscillospiraceae bacterium]|nr:hypothetical protein [Oscillospiraceae bacterium]